MKKRNNVFRYSLLVLALQVFVFFSCQEDNEDISEPNEYGDTELPLVIIQTPTAENVYSSINDSMSFSGIAQDNNSIEKVQWSINEGDKSDANGISSWSVRDISLEEGDNIFVVYAEDESSNSSSDTLIITKNKYLTFLGAPYFNPSGVAINEPTEVLITIKNDFEFKFSK